MKRATTFVSRIVRRITGACGWTLEAYDPVSDTYLLTCGDQHRVVPGEAMNDWIEQGDGTWAEPHG